MCSWICHKWYRRPKNSPPVYGNLIFIKKQPMFITVFTEMLANLHYLYQTKSPVQSNTHLFRSFEINAPLNDLLMEAKIMPLHIGRELLLGQSLSKIAGVTALLMFSVVMVTYRAIELILAQINEKKIKFSSTFWPFAQSSSYIYKDSFYSLIKIIYC